MQRLEVSGAVRLL